MSAMDTLAPLPAPGLFWGPYPQRPQALHDPKRDVAGRWLHAQGLGVLETLHALAEPWLARGKQHARATWLALVRQHQAEWAKRHGAEAHTHRQQLRAQLARKGWAGAQAPLLAQALGAVADASQRSLQRNPFDTQLLAAQVMLNEAFAEMATGEGKTLAAALAASVAALAGVPVHVMTVNDYLVQRDAELLLPLYRQLGLSVGTVVAGMAPEARRAAYACDVTYCTAREVAFDYLRDQLARADAGNELLQRRPAQERPEGAKASGMGVGASGVVLRGLCMAVADEADSLLIDEATLPLILAEVADDSNQRAACFQALGLAKQLVLGQDFQAATHGIEWTDAGRERLRSLATRLGGAWHNQRHAHELVSLALQALHLLHKDKHYLVQPGPPGQEGQRKLQLLDAATGRIAEGRQWSRGLHTLVELKEGCVLSPHTVQRSQISFQGFFARYLRLGGMSGTLQECRAEVRALYRRRVVPIPLRRPSRRELRPTRLYSTQAERMRAIVARVAQLHAQGRPVLVGMASVGESETLSKHLAEAGITHRVLNARHDAAEAAIVAEAGKAGAVTVATQMAGRGTDILLDPVVEANGGLHVLNAQDNPNSRLDRQLVGRCARQGDRGSAETWHCLESAVGVEHGRSRIFLGGRKPDPQGAFGSLWARAWAARVKRRSERRAQQLRRHLLEQDLEWQRHLSFNTVRA